VIRTVVLVVQGENEIGFLEGLRDCLGCGAQSVHYLQNHPELRLRSQYTRKKEANDIWRVYRGADLVIRLTDGDTDRPQDACREELKQWPGESHPLLICGVCDRDIEYWMCIDAEYAASRLECRVEQLPRDRKDRSGFVKNRIETVRGGQPYRDFVADFVRAAPKKTIRRWLDNPAFAHFYEQCRDRAQQAGDCPMRNLRD
jgi:hypothetical protein